MAEALKGEFRYIPIGKVIFGPGTAATRVRGEIEALGARRVLIVTGRTLASNTDLVAKVQAALGAAHAGVFQDTIQHVPRATVLAGARVAQELAADALVVVGGGTAVDTAKGIALVVAEGPDLDAHKTRFEPPDKRVVPPLPNPKLPLIVIPTTLSGSEFTHAIGITDVTKGSKELYVDPKLSARTIILDPEMTVATGRELWAGTCLKALCDCIEGICSPGHQPYSDALLTAAAEMIFQNLPVSVAEPLDLAARGRLQYASWMAVGMLLIAGGGLAAGLRHQIGALRNVPHGIASTIVIPHVMEFNRPVVAERLALIARAAGVDGAGRSAGDAAQAAITAVRDLIRQMELPTRLRDVGVQREDFDAIAEHVLHDFTARTNPRPVSSKEQVMEVLANAY